MFGQRAQDGSQGPLKQDDARQSIEVLRSLKSMSNQLAGTRFSGAPREQRTLMVSEVELSVRLDLFAHGASRGVDQVGGAILRLIQDDAETDGAKARRREMRIYVAIVARLHDPPRGSLTRAYG